MKKSNLHRGFSIVEVLVAIALMAITIASITWLVVSTIQANSANMNSFVGSQLSQEGIEIVRNMRDSNWLRNFDWLGSNNPKLADYGANFKMTPVSVGKKYYFAIDINPYYPSFANSAAYSGQESEIDLQNHPWKIYYLNEDSLDSDATDLYRCKDVTSKLFYSHNAKVCGNDASKSLFSRYIVLEPISVPEYGDRPLVVKVSSIVTWREKSGIKKVELTEEFTDWRQSPL